MLRGDFHTLPYLCTNPANARSDPNVYHQTVALFRKHDWNTLRQSCNDDSLIREDRMAGSRKRTLSDCRVVACIDISVLSWTEALHVSRNPDFVDLPSYSIESYIAARTARSRKAQSVILHQERASTCSQKANTKIS